MVEIKIKAENNFVIVNDGHEYNEYIWCWSQYRELRDGKFVYSYIFNPNHQAVIFNSRQHAEDAMEKISNKDYHKEGAVIMCVEDYIKLYWRKFHKLPKNIDIDLYLNKVD